MSRAAIAAVIGLAVLGSIAAPTGARADDARNLMGYRLVRSGLATKEPKLDIVVDASQMGRLLPELQQMGVFNAALTPVDVATHLHRTVATYCFVVTQAALNTVWVDTKAQDVRVTCAGQYGKTVEPVFSARYDRQLAPKLSAGMETVDFMMSATAFAFSPSFHTD